jgi:CheY-like chemotaxis protein
MMSGGSAQTVGPGRALIVDDDSDVREVTSMCMELVGGWAVSEADCGLAALEMASAELPDVILLDMMMPGIDGIETRRRLLADPATNAIPVIFLTAKAEVAVRSLLAGIDVCGFIAKPFEPMGIADQVAAILASSRTGHD